MRVHESAGLFGWSYKWNQRDDPLVIDGFEIVDIVSLDGSHGSVVSSVKPDNTRYAMKVE